MLFNDWNRRFYDSLQNKDEAVFWREIIIFSVLAAVLHRCRRRARGGQPLPAAALAALADAAPISRTGSTAAAITASSCSARVDNADQRIAEDLRLLGEYTMPLLLGMLGAVATLVSFLFILWQLSGPLSLALHRHRRHHSRLHGLGGADLCRSSAPSSPTWWAGALIALNFQKQRYEAELPLLAWCGCARMPRASPSTTASSARPTPSMLRFADIFANGWRVLLTQAQLAFYQVGLRPARRSSSPIVVTAPRFFAGAITLGVMMQTASAFGQVQTALSFFIDNYTYLAELRAVMDRLKGLQAATDDKPATAIDVVPQAGRQDVGAEG